MATNKRLEQMAQTRAKLISAAREAFAKKGFAATSMDELTADVGLTRGALYHNFVDKKGLLAAVVAQVDSEMAARAHAQVQRRRLKSDWDKLVAEGVCYMELALDPEIQRIVLLDGPAFLGDPSRWPSQDSCLNATVQTLTALRAQGVIKDVDVEAAARLMNGAALNAALWVAASDDPSAVLPKAIRAFEHLMSGFLRERDAA